MIYLVVLLLIGVIAILVLNEGVHFRMLKEMQRRGAHRNPRFDSNLLKFCWCDYKIEGNIEASHRYVHDMQEGDTIELA